MLLLGALLIAAAVLIGAAVVATVGQCEEAGGRWTVAHGCATPAGVPIKI